MPETDSTQSNPPASTPTPSTPAPATTTSTSASPTAPPSAGPETPAGVRTAVLVNGGTHVLMHNPATGGTWECPNDYADIALADGWEFAPDPNAQVVGTDVADALNALAAEQAPPLEAEPTGWNPDEHTADEINDYVAEMVATERAGEAARVVELEKVGKNRKSVHDPFTPTS